MTALSALAAAAFAPPDGFAIPEELERALRVACAGAWRAVEVVLAGDVLRGRIAKTRDAIVRDAVESILELHGNVGIRADALAALREARDAGELDGALDLPGVVAGIRQDGAVAAGRGALTAIRRDLAHRRELEQALADTELASLLVDCARAILRNLARDPELARWAIGPTGSPGRDRALAAFAELAASPESIAELETLIAVPIHLDDNVQFTVYRPRAIDPGKWHQLLAFAHLAERRPGEDDLPDPVEEVQRQAASVLGAKAQQYQPVVQDSGAAIPEEGELTFVPEFPGIEVNPPRRSFLWLETVHREEFRIRAPRELDGKTVRGRVTVFLGHIAIAEVALSVRVDAQAGTQEKKREPTHARAYRKIFASYSHRDLEIVNQFETYARALGDEYLRDWVHLRTGEVWNDRLCQLIDQSDAFQLFWSRNSMQSKFVRQEYEYALSLNRPSFVRPTYWEDPMPTAPGLPPDALLRLHFQKLSAAMIGDVTARTDSQPVIARQQRAKDAKEELAIDREREPQTLKETNRWAGEEEHDVTDPTFTLPESIDSPDEETSKRAPDRVAELRRRAVSTPKGRTPRSNESDPVVKRAKLDEDSLDTPREPDPFGAPPAAQPRPTPVPARSSGGTMPPSMVVPSIPGPPRPASSTPSTPAPMRPSPAPSAPAPVRPSAPAPSAPAPMRPQPAPAPMRPAPGPSAPPSAPAPMYPGPSARPSAPAPSGPASMRRSAPSAPAPSAPAPMRPAPGPSAPPSAPAPIYPSAPRPGPSAPSPSAPAMRPSAPASRPTAPSPMALRPESAAKPVFTQPTAPAIPPRMPAPNWDDHQAGKQREDDDDVIPPPVDSMLAEREREPTPFDTLVAERKQLDQALVDEAKFDPKRIVTSPGVGPAKPAKIPHTNPHAAPPPPAQPGATCMVCLGSNQIDARFCRHCGSVIGETVSPMAAPMTPPAPPAPMMAAPMEMPAPMPAIAKAKTVMADPELRTTGLAAGLPASRDERSPWAPPSVAQPPSAVQAPPRPPVMPGLSPIVASHSAPVSPYAPTVPSEVYQPKPGDALYGAQPGEPTPKMLPNAPESRRSILPILLVVVGVVIVVAVIVAWLLR